MPVVDVDDDLLARRVRGLRTTIAVGRPDAPPSLGWLCRVFRGLAFGGGLLRVLQDKLQLIEVGFSERGP